MLSDFRTYQMAKELYHQTKKVRLPSFLKNQLLRASSSVVLNLAEGSARRTAKDRQRFYNMAFASLREVQAIIDLERRQLDQLHSLADSLGAHLYRLGRNCPR